MKILLLSQDWFKKELQEAGHEVVSCGADGHFDIRLSASFLRWSEVVSLCPWEPEAVMVYDNSVPLFVAGLEELQIPVLFYSVDIHHHLAWQKPFRTFFDHLLVAQKDFIPHFAEGPAPVSWLPLWATHVPELSTQKNYEAVFVGTINPALNAARVAFFEELTKLAPVTCLRGEHWNIYPHAKVIVNQTVRTDLNFRVFESMISGVPLVTDRVGNGQFELFQDGVHFCTYEQNNAQDAAQKIEELLKDPMKASHIGEAGRALILKSHLPSHRAQELLRILATIKPSTNRSRYSLVHNFITLGLFVENEKRNPAPAYGEAVRLIEEGMAKNEPMNFEYGQSIMQALSHFDRISKSAKAALVLDALIQQYPQWFKKG